MDCPWRVAVTWEVLLRNEGAAFALGTHNLPWRVGNVYGDEGRVCTVVTGAVRECPECAAVSFSASAWDDSFPGSPDSGRTTAQLGLRKLRPNSADLQVIIRKRWRQFADLIRPLKDAPERAVLPVVRET